MSVHWAILAVIYDHQMAKSEEAGLREMRRRLIAEAAGDVLEIGAGTGANLGHYGPEVRSLTVTEPQPAMLRRLEQHVREQAPDATVLRAPAEDLPFDDDSFDVVVSTLVMCGVEDQQRTLRQLARVLRPGGRLLFLEHVRSDEARLARWQDRLNWFNRAVVCCECNRPTLDSIKAAGFEPGQVDRLEFPKSPPFIRPLILGTARLPQQSSGQSRPSGTTVGSVG
ncbi:class I SAM-dependent methyltransferase [Streptacidiphilus melanogenes]|uniref:class I SAM-dependent methyltransferase n=1 Tax=Streptacidiphilus melanogenes TaxID=411235 RepID=UPI0005A64DF9|nr:class I SAM-dependent methyltransferase [Streptacidiphilus melanogenes]